MNNVINWFEIPVADMDRAVAFYEPVMQVTLKRENMECAEMAVFPYQDPAPGGALAKFDSVKPSDQGCIIYLHTDNLTATLETRQLCGRKLRFWPL
ncbi:glyoxalase [Klebsiella oxytoca]|nr:glyoxalase [Klebsiella oxytoca]